MARLPRLALDGHTHLVLQRAHGSAGAAGRAALAPTGLRPLFIDEADRRTYRAALFETAAAEGVAVHAWALCDTEVLLLLTPATASGLSRLMQALGRRYVNAYHRRHGGSGTLWDGRFRAALVEPGPMRLAALCWVDAADRVAGAAGGIQAPAASPAIPVIPPVSSLAPHSSPGQAVPGPVAHTSAPQRLGAAREPGLQDPPELWPLGNTPFEREAAYRALLARGLPATQAGSLRRAALGGWALGSASYTALVAEALARPAGPRARGRPRAALQLASGEPLAHGSRRR